MEQQPKRKTDKSKKSSNEVLEELNTLLGRIPPQSPDLEKAVLGALLIQSDAIYDIRNILIPDSFYVPIHQTIYQSIVDLSSQNKPIDVITVSEDLKIKNQLEEIGGIAFLMELTDRIGTSSHIEYHARIVQQKYIQRELIKSSTEIQKASYDESKDVEELINFAEGEIFNISERSAKKEISKIGEIITQAKNNISEAAKNKGKLIGVPSGFSELDSITSGWQPSDLIIVAARPAMGKTAFVLSMARNIAVDSKKTVALFSLEMSSIQLATRLISAEIEVPGEKIRRGELESNDWKFLETKLAQLETAPMYIDDTPAISIFELRAKCRRLARSKEGLGIVIIDYLQLMTAGVDTRGNREQEVSTISRSLKAIAKELNVPIIALSQLNRSVETRGNDKRPSLSDLRESGAIEQDADIVTFIHRPEYYGLTETNSGESLRGVATVIIAKHRNGKTADVDLIFKSDYAKFVDKPKTIEEYGVGGSYTVGSKMNDFEYGNTFATPTQDLNSGFDNLSPLSSDLKDPFNEPPF